MNPKIKKFLQIVLFFSIGITILVLMYNDLNNSYQAECALKEIPESECNLFTKLKSDFQSANYLWLLVITVAFIISNISRTYRWIYLLKPMGYPIRFINGFLSVMLGYFINLGAPRFGEFARAASISKYEKIPVEKALGTVTVDRIIDSLSFLFVFLLGILFNGEKLLEVIRKNAGISSVQTLFTNPVVLISLSVFVVGLIMIYFRRKQLKKWRLYQKIENIISGFGEGIKSIALVEKKGLFIFHSVMIWLMYYLMTYLCFQAFESTAHLSAAAGLLVFIMGSLGMIIPTPGGMGSYHYLVQLGLVIYGVSQEDSFSFSMIIFFTINIFGNILFGLLAVWLLPLINKKKSSESYA